MRTRCLGPCVALALLLVNLGAFGQSTDKKAAGSIEALEEQAASGDAKAEYDLGQLYAAGRGVPQDFTVAAGWFRKAAEQGLVVAETRLAGLLLVGRGVAQSTREGIAWYQKAAKQGDVTSSVVLGQLYEDGGPQKLGPQKLIEEPDGKVSDVFVPVPGGAIPKDFVMAAIWYRKAAEQGLALAQNDLGRLYFNGQGVPQNYSEAYFWLNLGEANGSTSSTDGVDDRDLAASHLTSADLSRVQERARKWFEDHPAKPQ